MTHIGPANSRVLVQQAVAKCRINAAHLAIAQLIKAGIVDRVLTTNFDPLIVRACALINTFPTVFDLTVGSGRFSTTQLGRISGQPAVFHLHGQHDGFILLHEMSDVRRYRAAIKPLLEDAAEDRVWLVVGYSGQNDPLVSVLGRHANTFTRYLYWATYGTSEPCDTVTRELLDRCGGTRVISGYDSDALLVALATRLGCYPPDILMRPIGTLRERLLALAPQPRFAVPSAAASFRESPWAGLAAAGQRGESEIIQHIGDSLQHALEASDETTHAFRRHASVLLDAVAFDKAIQLCDTVDESTVDADLLALALAKAHFGRAFTKFCENLPIRGELPPRGVVKRIRDDLAVERVDRAFPIACLIDAACISMLVRKSTSDEERTTAIEAIDERASRFLQMRPEQEEFAAYGIGQAFLAVAERTPIAKAAPILELGIRVLMRAYVLNEANATICAMLCGAHLHLARATNEADGPALVDAAERFGREAEAIKSSTCPYDLACVASLKQQADACQRWLKQFLDRRPEFPDKVHVTDDPDMAWAREQQWFDGLFRQFPSHG